jgi:transcription elongation GreA/GreB family factor
MARTLARSREGDTLTLRTPAGTESIEVLRIEYLPLP